MIIALILLLAATIMNVITASITFMISSFNLSFPGELSTGLSYILKPAFYFSGILPISDILLALTTLFGAFILVYIFKILIFFLNLVPTINRLQKP